MNDKQYTAMLMNLGRKLTNGQLSAKDYEERLTTIMAAYATAKQVVAEQYKIATDAANYN